MTATGDIARRTWLAELRATLQPVRGGRHVAGLTATSRKRDSEAPDPRESARVDHWRAEAHRELLGA